MHRREFLRMIAAAGAGATLANVAIAAEASIAGRRPNIILVLTDDQGYGDLGRHGNPVLQTPNLDRMYDQSVRLTDFHVSPTCAPTRCSILTGMHEFKSGVTHTILERERMSLKRTTLAQVIKSAGYSTGIFGKWHLGDEPERWPDKRGFDEVYIHGCGGIGQTYAGSCGDVPGNRYFDPVVLHNGTFEKTGGYCTDVFFSQAMKWIETAGKSPRPFFMMITPNAPHAPLDVPKKYEEMYAGKVGANAAKFFGMIANIDENIGRLFAKLKELGIDENTLVIFMNDNGGTAGVGVFNAGMRGQKGTAWEGGTRAMSLWRWPGTLRPADRDALTAHVDLFPTLAAIAGAKVPEQVAAGSDGFNLVPLLEGKEVSWPDRFLVTHVGRWENGKARESKYGACSVRWRKYHLVWNSPKRGAPGKWELYDLASDAGEKKDIAAANADVVKRMSDFYDRWWESVLPRLENEDAWKTAPKVNPLKELYWKQYNGPGPNNAPRPAVN